MSEPQSKDTPKTSQDYEAMVNGMLKDNAPTVVPQMTKPRGNDSATATKSDTKEVPYQDKVNALIKEVTVDEATGKLVYPDNTPDHLKYAVAAEKKYRDTQGSYTKNQMSLKEIESENKALREQLAKTSQSALELPKEEAERLEDLMYSDPAAWRREMNDIEAKHSEDVQKGLKQSMSEVRQKAGADFEVNRRLEVLEEFNKGRKVPLTDEVIDNDIPPRLTKKLEDGHLTFEGFLAEVDEYLSKGRVVLNPENDNGSTLSKGAGSTKAPADSVLKQDAIDYASITF